MFFVWWDYNFSIYVRHSRGKTVDSTRWLMKSRNKVLQIEISYYEGLVVLKWNGSTGIIKALEWLLVSQAVYSIYERHVKVPIYAD